MNARDVWENEDQLHQSEEPSTRLILVWELKKLNPSHFKGGFDADMVESWLREVKKLMDVSAILTEHHVVR